MSTMLKTTLAAAAILAVMAAIPAQAQVGTNGGQAIGERGRPGWEGNGGRTSITVYQDAWFQGRSTSFSGEVRDLRNSAFNDQISSMRFQGRWEACTDGDFRGQCRTFSDDVSDLVRFGMNDRISSLRPVRGGGNGGGWGGGHGGGGDGGGWNDGRASITVYRDGDFQGSSRSFDDEVQDLRPLGFNDEISSVRLRGAWELCEDSYFRGRCQVVDGNLRSLRDIGLNDRVSSMRPARRGGGW